MLLLLALLPSIQAQVPATAPPTHGAAASLPAVAVNKAPVGPFTTLAPTAFKSALPYGPELATALASRDWATALPLLQKIDRGTLPGNLTGDHAFVLAWTLDRLDRAKEAVTLLEPVRAAVNAPSAYVQLMVGELLLADGKPVDAITALEKLPEDGPIQVRAALALAEAYRKAERTAESRAVYLSLAMRPDPAPGSSIALWALAQKVGLTSPDGLEYLRRLYRSYPGSAEDKAAAASMPAPSLEDISYRGDRLQEAGNYSGAVALLAPRLGEVGTKDAIGCRYRYAYGRAQNKLSNITSAAEVLGPLGAGCVGKDDDRGAKALYIAGKSLERKKEWSAAASMYAQIPARYPAHSMADDGYALGGVAMQEGGDLAGARSLWAKGYEARPEGDLAAESAWRLAFGAFLDGDTPEAIRWADRASAELALSSSPTDVLAARYWGARWRAWPSITDTRKLTTDAASLATAVDGLERVARDAPWHYYGLLASARLAELAPERAAALTRPIMDPDDAPWQVRDQFRARPAVQNAMGLARVGLLTDALTELNTLDDEELTGAEMAIVTGLMTDSGSFLYAHDRLRAYLKNHPPDVLGPNPYKVLRQAYPNRYWDDVQAVAGAYSWDARVFHALVREESNFNPKIKSHAGACGLSQLMPGTASGCAKRMGVSYSSTNIWDVQTNLKIGAWYLDTLHTRYKGNSALALAGYNAGEGNSDRWLAARPDAPTDLIVETISFRETRHYVKRVMSTWLTYRMLYGDGPVYADARPFVHDAVP
ncbi:MAG: transglycosylase SLT domain-containing protein [Pseudomonadota bacterium]|nr:transglycosylase SLT domain-containing protein [Pseudomonadota bacterium]